MKKPDGTVKIDVIRRPGLPPVQDGHQISTKIYKNKFEHEQTPSNHGNDLIYDQEHYSALDTYKTNRVNQRNGANTISTLNTNGVHLISSTPSSPFLQSRPSPKQIPSTTKWSTRKKVLVGSVVAATLIVLATVAIVLGVLLTQTTSTTTATTTASPTVVSVLWSFDNTTADVYNVYNGQIINAANFSSNIIGSPYVAPGRALGLTLALNQSFLVTTPFLNLAFTSFTIEMFIYLSTTSTDDRGIFSQCACIWCSNQCLNIILRSNTIYAGFTSNDIASSIVLVANRWYHVAFVYNYQAQQQLIYIDGVQNRSKSNAQPYQGQNGTIRIGASQISSTTNYFDGFIDSVSVVTRAKSSSEILNDATLLAYYSFDQPFPNNDNSQSGINGTAVNTIIISGRVNQAMRFTGILSSFQVFGIHRFSYAQIFSRPYSIALWINPTSVAASAFFQVSINQSATTCSNIFGFLSTGGSNSQLLAQGYYSPWQFATIIGPPISINTWTHISLTFSLTNGYSLYVNGNLFGSTGTVVPATTGVHMVWLYLGNGINCYTNYFTNLNYQGAMDEIYLYTRELTQAEVSALANP